MSLERTAVPREFSSPRRFTRRFRIIVGLVAFAAVSGPVGCVAAFANKPAEVVPAAEPRHAGYAAAVAESYLAGQPLPVAVASGLPASGGRDPVAVEDAPPRDDEAAPAAIPHRWLVLLEAEVLSIPAADGATRPVETHRFLVGGEGAPFVLTVSLVETAGGVPALGAVPAIEPSTADPAAAALPALDWSEVVETERPGAALRERIAEWAAAYAADDRRRLLEITGDRRTGIAYAGLGTWSLVGEPVAGGVLTRGDGYSACQVELTLVALGDSEVTTSVAFDLLVDNAADAVPAVVAWGPAGTALALQPYANATPLPDEPGGAGTTTTTTAGAEAGEGAA